MKHSIAVAALVVTSLGLTAAPSFAQDAGAATVQPAKREVHRTITRDAGRGGRGANILGVVCSPDGAEALEIAFVRWSHRLELTTEQQPLFDAFKTKALTTQTSFADECAVAMPDAAANATPDLLTNLKARLAIEEAKVTAMNSLLPDFEKLYTSLSDEQKADLMPRGNGNGDRMGRGGGNDRNGPGRTHRLPAPGR